MPSERTANLSGKRGPAKPDALKLPGERLGHVREQLEQGAYDEDAALEAALDRLARDLGVELE